MALVPRKIILPWDTPPSHPDRYIVASSSLARAIIAEDPLRGHMAEQRSEFFAYRERLHGENLSRLQDSISGLREDQEAHITALRVQAQDADKHFAASQKAWEERIETMAQDGRISRVSADRLLTSLRKASESFSTTDRERLYDMLRSMPDDLELSLARSFAERIDGQDTSWHPEKLAHIPTCLADILDVLPMKKNSNKRSMLMLALMGVKDVPAEKTARIPHLIAVAAQMGMIDYQDIDGNTALSMAVTAGYVEAVRLLMESSASVTIQNKRGFSPAKYAVLSQDGQILSCVFGSRDIVQRSSFQNNILNGLRQYAEDQKAQTFLEMYFPKRPTPSRDEPKRNEGAARVEPAPSVWTQDSQTEEAGASRVGVENTSVPSEDVSAEPDSAAPEVDAGVGSSAPMADPETGRPQESVPGPHVEPEHIEPEILDPADAPVPHPKTEGDVVDAEVVSTYRTPRGALGMADRHEDVALEVPKKKKKFLTITPKARVELAKMGFIREKNEIKNGNGEVIFVVPSDIRGKKVERARIIYREGFWVIFYDWDDKAIGHQAILAPRDTVEDEGQGVTCVIDKTAQKHLDEIGFKYSHPDIVDADGRVVCTFQEIINKKNICDIKITMKRGILVAFFYDKQKGVKNRRSIHQMEIPLPIPSEPDVPPTPEAASSINPDVVKLEIEEWLQQQWILDQGLQLDAKGDGVIVIKRETVEIVRVSISGTQFMSAGAYDQEKQAILDSIRAAQKEAEEAARKKEIKINEPTKPARRLLSTHKIEIDGSVFRGKKWEELFDVSTIDGCRFVEVRMEAGKIMLDIQDEKYNIITRYAIIDGKYPEKIS